MFANPFDSRTGFMEHAAVATLQLSGFSSLSVTTPKGRVHALRAQGGGRLPPFVLVHGFSSQGAHYFNLMRHLRPHVSGLTAPDAPGHGFSYQPSRVAPGELLGGLFDALDRLVDEPSIVYGNSMGGLAALRFALHRPEKVRGLVLASPFGAPMTPAQIDEFLRQFRVQSHDEALDFVDRVFQLDGPFRHLLAWGVRRKFGHPSMRALLDALDPADLLRPEEVSALLPPVLFLWGGAERVLPREHRDFFLQHLPAHAQVAEPPRFGHGPCMEHPRAVAQHLLDFARSLGTPRSTARA